MSAPQPATVAACAAALRSGELTATDLAEHALSRARDTAGDSGAFVELCARQAREEARHADAELAAGHDRGPLHGVPVAVKDVIDVVGVATRCGTPGLGHHVPEDDATVVRRLRGAGAVVVGKTHTHELAWGMVTPQCRNPRDTARMTGGSSGGSAAAVAAGIVPLALGTDTGGSVRNPAALCGVAGLKASHGAVPMQGVAPLAPSQDSLGLLAATAADCRVGLSALHAAENPPDVGSGPAAVGEALRVGVMTDGWAGRVDGPVAGAVQHARDVLAAAGARCLDVTVALSELAPAVSYVVMLAESAELWWPRARATAAGLGPQARATLQLGTQVRAMDYLRALRAGEALRAHMLATLEGADALLLPACPAPAPPAGATAVTVAGRAEPVEAAHSRLTALASTTGLPALSVPCGTDGAGLPLAVQLVGKSPDVLCAIAQLIEAEHPDTPGATRPGFAGSTPSGVDPDAS